ncbi:MAG TPA: ATP-binding protein [Chitinophagaceae bacterium]|nr:ATP-binding protein [Chitinophagaceae bacterium]
MKKKFVIFLFLWLPLVAIAQQSTLDELRHQLANAQSDSGRYEINGKLLDFYIERKIDSALFFMEQCLLLARKNNKKLNEASSLSGKGLCLRHLGRYSESLQCYLAGFEIAQNVKSERDFWPLPLWMFAPDKTARSSRLIVLGNLHMQIANLFIRTGNNDKCIYHFAEAEKIGKETQNHYFLYYLYATMGIAYKNLNKLDSAMLIVQNGLSLAKQFGYKQNVSRLLTYIGEIHFSRENTDTARKYYYDALQLALVENNFVSLVMIYFGLTKSFMVEHEKDSSLYYAKKANETLTSVGSLAGTVWNPATAYENLFRVYELRKEPDSAYKYMELAMRAKDSLNTYTVKSSAQAQDLFLSEQIRLQELEKEKIQFRNKVETYSMLAGIVVLLLLAIIFYRNNRQKQKAKINIEKAYDELKATQAQLIQQEKMASLGELTAGIAHEIQNPLNFVNNFSEVSNELVDEMKNELATGNMQLANEIVDDIKQNLEKINHHGKRADAIVKGMLQHSRSSSGKKEATDINALADEYLRLAYHGIRAKDKSFTVTTYTDFDESLSADGAGMGKINVVPQDIGRAILNLINNAFYAVDEKKKASQILKEGVDYEPTVTVSTKKEKDKAEIKVKDNGNGIPQKVVDKIFQPFFTTKPTGQGTGLGLSLSYDIIKAHGGELKVKTKEGEFSEFIIELPLK